MSECALCATDRTEGAETLIRSAFVQRAEMSLPVQGATRTTFTFDQFQDHAFFVCADCRRQARSFATGVWILTAAVMACAVLGFLALRAKNQAAAGWLFLLVLAALVAGGIVASLRDINARLKRLAVQARGGTTRDSRLILPVQGRFRAFTEAEYQDLRTVLPPH